MKPSERLKQIQDEKMQKDPMAGLMGVVFGPHDVINALVQYLDEEWEESHQTCQCTCAARPHALECALNHCKHAQSQPK